MLLKAAILIACCLISQAFGVPVVEYGNTTANATSAPVNVTSHTSRDVKNETAAYEKDQAEMTHGRNHTRSMFNNNENSTAQEENTGAVSNQTNARSNHTSALDYESLEKILAEERRKTMAEFANILSEQMNNGGNSKGDTKKGKIDMQGYVEGIKRTMLQQIQRQILWKSFAFTSLVSWAGQRLLKMWLSWVMPYVNKLNYNLNRDGGLVQRGSDGKFFVKLPE